MAKYSKGAGKKAGKLMHEMKEGKLKSGSGKKVTSRKQAIAIALSEARGEGAKVPKKNAPGGKATAPVKAAGRQAATKTAKKGAAKKAPGKNAASKSNSKVSSQGSKPSQPGAKKASAKKAPSKKRTTKKAAPTKGTKASRKGLKGRAAFKKINQKNR